MPGALDRQEESDHSAVLEGPRSRTKCTEKSRPAQTMAVGSVDACSVRLGDLLTSASPRGLWDEECVLAPPAHVGGHVEEHARLPPSYSIIAIERAHGGRIAMGRATHRPLVA